MTRSTAFVLLAILALAAPDLARGGEAGAPAAPGEAARRRIEKLLAGEFRWTMAAPLLGPADRPGDPCDSIKDPTIVFSGGRWHLFATIRSKKRTHQIEYLSFPEFRRYYKAYLADRLDGQWTPLAATSEKPFASPVNCRDGAGAAHWSDSVSHGELLRAGRDQRLEVDPANLRFLFQGVADGERAGKGYGQIPWRLGLLEPVE